ncbi:MAG: hypothetical protein WAW17_11670 [Rhodococcus sp. (in: high G+C Gram-positive bacteria)]|uniref:hypothetical protein n=1 Tax=Rhodococcus sp. TaxID=1831 RepID=UPI003BB03597
MGIRKRLYARDRERRRAWSQRVLDAAVEMITADANTDVVSAGVDYQPEYVRIVYRSRWWPRVLGYRGYVPASDRRDSVREFAEYLSRLSVCEPLGNQAEVLTIDGGIEWWGDGYPTFALASIKSSDTARGHSDAVIDDDAVWARWRARGLIPQTETAPARQLGAPPRTIHTGYPVRTVLRHLEPDQEFGDLPAAVLKHVCTVLDRHTTAGAQCWFGVWDGRAWINDTPHAFTPYLREGQKAPPPPKPALPSMILHGPRAEIDGMHYVLFAGPVAAAPEMGWNPTPAGFWREWPNLIWPSDHAWLAECGIDDDFAVMSGTAALIDDLDTIAGISVERMS